jgi:hypothetical protein
VSDREQQLLDIAGAGDEDAAECAEHDRALESGAGFFGISYRHAGAVYNTIMGGATRAEAVRAFRRLHPRVEVVGAGA